MAMVTDNDCTDYIAAKSTKGDIVLYSASVTGKHGTRRKPRQTAETRDMEITGGSYRASESRSINEIGTAKRAIFSGAGSISCVLASAYARHTLIMCQ
jgi:hypothetical protein